MNLGKEQPICFKCGVKATNGYSLFKGQTYCNICANKIKQKVTHDSKNRLKLVTPPNGKLDKIKHFFRR